MNLQSYKLTIMIAFLQYVSFILKTISIKTVLIFHLQKANKIYNLIKTRTFLKAGISHETVFQVNDRVKRSSFTMTKLGDKSKLYRSIAVERSAHPMIYTTTLLKVAKKLDKNHLQKSATDPSLIYRNLSLNLRLSVISDISRWSSRLLGQSCAGVVEHGRRIKARRNALTSSSQLSPPEHYTTNQIWQPNSS